MELFDEDTFDADLIEVGAEEVRKEGGFSSSVEEEISDGLIKTLGTLISDSGMFNKIVDDVTTGGKEKLGSVIEAIMRNKENDMKSEEIREEISTLLDNHNIEDLTSEKGKTDVHLSEKSQKLERLIELVTNYIENKNENRESKNKDILKTSKKERKQQHSI